MICDELTFLDTSSKVTSDGWINGFCNDTIDTKKNRESRKELGPDCGSDCRKPVFLNLCKKSEEQQLAIFYFMPASVISQI